MTSELLKKLELEKAKSEKKEKEKTPLSILPPPGINLPPPPDWIRDRCFKKSEINKMLIGG